MRYSILQKLGKKGIRNSLFCLAGLAGAVSVNAAVVSTDMTSNSANTAPFTGAEAIEITNGATVTLNAAHNFSGAVTITNGRLILKNENGFKNSTTFNIGTNGILEFASKSPFSSDRGNIPVKTITIEEGGLLNFTAASGDKFANIDHLILNGGTVAGETAHDSYGSYLLRGNITANKSSEISANLTVRGGWGIVGGKTLWSVAENAVLTLSGRVRYAETGTGANPDFPTITKTGSGSLLLTNTALDVHPQAELIISGGMVEAQRSASLHDGKDAVKITVNNGKMLFSGSDNAEIKNDIFIAQDQNAEISSSVSRTYSGDLTGKGTFNVRNNGWVYTYLTGDNSNFEGTLKNVGGVLFFKGNNSATPNAIFHAADIVCFLPNSAENSLFAFGSLTGNGTLRTSIDSAANITIQVGALNQDSVFNGTITDFDRDKNTNYDKAVTLEKIGTGTLTLTNADNKFRNGLTVKNGTLKFTTPGAAGRGSITLTKNTDSEFGKLLYQGNGNVTNSVAIAEGAAFTFISTDDKTTYSGNLTGTGIFEAASNKFLRLDGDNSQFAGTFKSSNAFVFFQNKLSASPNAEYQMTNPFVLKPLEANAVYQFGAVNWTGSEIRYSNETDQNYRNAVISVGHLNKDDYIKTLFQNNIALEKAGNGTLTIEKHPNGNNSYSLGTTVKNGTLKFTHPSVLGTGAVKVTKSSDSEFGTLVYSGTSGTFSNALDLAQGTSFKVNAGGQTLEMTGALTGAGSINTAAGTLNYSGNSSALEHSINIENGAAFRLGKTLTLNGGLTGTGTIINSAYGSRFKGDNALFAGTIQLDQLAYFHNPQSTSANSLYSGNGNIILLLENAQVGNTYEFGALTDNDFVRASSSSNDRPHYVKVGGLNTDFTFNGIFADYTSNRKLGLIKTGTGTMTITADHSKIPLDPVDSDNVKPFSLGAVIENGTLKIAQGAVVGSSENDLFMVNAASGDLLPGICIEGTINGRLQVDGNFVIDFADGAFNDTGNVIGDISFGEDAALTFLLPENGILDEAAYTLYAANSDELLNDMIELYQESVIAGTAPEGFSISAVQNGILLSAAGITPPSGVPEPAAWILFLAGSAGLFFMKKVKK
ncbi:MAG: PEP-CTERM sorting domain-containing protein [Planctomycetaceae bacterium]|nr:PEP-CTERM sorting domain-containing protein [Planctomycetaceae bacterium]